MKLPNANRETKVLGYVRVSTAKQEVSPEVQKKACHDWYQQQTAKNAWPAGSRWLGCLEDKAVSGEVGLFQRPKGQHILTELERGDVLVASKMSRLFRSSIDALKTIEALRESGIQLVMLDVGIDTSTITGKAMLGMLAVFFQFERELIAERTQEALQHIIAEGKWSSPKTPPGWKRPGNRRLDQHGRQIRDIVPDEEMRAVGEWAAKQLAAGKGIDRVTARINANLGLNKNRSPMRPFSNDRVLRMATYCVCDWPPVTIRMLRESLGLDGRAMATFIRENYRPPEEREKITSLQSFLREPAKSP